MVADGVNRVHCFHLFEGCSEEAESATTRRVCDSLKKLANELQGVFKKGCLKRTVALELEICAAVS